MAKNTWYSPGHSCNSLPSFAQNIETHAVYAGFAAHWHVWWMSHNTNSKGQQQCFVRFLPKSYERTWLSGMLADRVGKSQKRVVQLLAVQFFELFDLKVDSTIAAYPDPSFPCEGCSLQGCIKLLLFCDIMAALLNMTLTLNLDLKNCM